MAAAVAPYPVAAVWATLPGYSPAYAAAFIVACDGDPAALDRDRFCAAVGRYPQRSQSGAHDVTRRGRSGYRPAVDALHLWTFNLVGAKQPNPVQAYYAGGEKADGKKFTAAKTKLARLLHGLATSGSPYTYTPTTQETDE